MFFKNKKYNYDIHFIGAESSITMIYDREEDRDKAWDELTEKWKQRDINKCYMFISNNDTHDIHTYMNPKHIAFLRKYETYQ